MNAHVLAVLLETCDSLHFLEQISWNIVGSERDGLGNKSLFHGVLTKLHISNMYKGRDNILSNYQGLAATKLTFKYFLLHFTFAFKRFLSSLTLFKTSTFIIFVVQFILSIRPEPYISNVFNFSMSYFVIVQVPHPYSATPDMRNV